MVSQWLRVLVIVRVLVRVWVSACRNIVLLQYSAGNNNYKIIKFSLKFMFLWPNFFAINITADYSRYEQQCSGFATQLLTSAKFMLYSNNL